MPPQGRRLTATREAAGAADAAPLEWNFASDEAPLLLRVRVEVAGRPLVEQFAELPCGADLRLDALLANTPMVSGRIVAAADGAPIADADVVLLSALATLEPFLREPKADARTKSGADGRFELPAKEPWATVRVTHRDFAPCQPIP